MHLNYAGKHRIGNITYIAVAVVHGKDEDAQTNHACMDVSHCHLLLLLLLLFQPAERAVADVVI
jgi:hypothetical protein